MDVIYERRFEKIELKPLDYLCMYIFSELCRFKNIFEINIKINMK